MIHQPLGPTSRLPAASIICSTGPRSKLLVQNARPAINPGAGGCHVLRDFEPLQVVVQAEWHVLLHAYIQAKGFQRYISGAIQLGVFLQPRDRSVRIRGLAVFKWANLWRPSMLEPQLPRLGSDVDTGKWSHRGRQVGLLAGSMKIVSLSRNLEE